MEKWKCTVCGYVHEGPLPEDFKCPKCKQPASKFEKIEEPANPYVGTQTEKNLQTAFAGESQARNKYTYFASKAKKDTNRLQRCSSRRRTMKKNTQSSGSRNLTESEQQRRTLQPQPQVRILSGPTCMTDSQRPLMKKASMSWLKNSAESQRLKSIMKSVIARCLPMWK